MAILNLRPQVKFEGKIIQLYKCTLANGATECFSCKCELGLNLYYFGIYAPKYGFKLFCIECEEKVRLLGRIRGESP